MKTLNWKAAWPFLAGTDTKQEAEKLGSQPKNEP